MRGQRLLPAGARSRPGADGVSHCVGPTHARERGVKAQRLPCRLSDRPAADSLPAADSVTEIDAFAAAAGVRFWHKADIPRLTSELAHNHLVTRQLRHVRRDCAGMTAARKTRTGAALLGCARYCAPCGEIAAAPQRRIWSKLLGLLVPGEENLTPDHYKTAALPLSSVPHPR